MIDNEIIVIKEEDHFFYLCLLFKRAPFALFLIFFFVFTQGDHFFNLCLLFKRVPFSLYLIFFFVFMLKSLRVKSKCKKKIYKMQ